MSPKNSSNNPGGQEFENLLENALGIRLAKVKHNAIRFSVSREFPNALVIKRTTVISVIEKRGKLSNLHAPGESK
jgi:hypothetical protein